MRSLVQHEVEHRLCVIFVMLVLAMPASARGADDAHPVDATDRSEWAGVWQLDRDSSDPIEPLLKQMEVAWVTRKIGNAMSPTLTISVLPNGGLRVLNQNPIQTTDRQIPAHGTPYERTDTLGRRVVSKEWWNDAGQLVVVDENHFDDDRIVVVTSTWTCAGDHIDLMNHVETEDGPLLIRRIFRRKP